MTQIESTKKYLKNTPWAKNLFSVQARCNDESHWAYKYYGGRGIKCLLNMKDIKYIWYRDKAHLLSRPSIDRINNDGNYTVRNCRFIELAENIRRSNKENPRRKRRPDIECIECCKVFYAIKKKVIFCSRKCGMLYVRRNKREANLLEVKNERKS